MSTKIAGLSSSYYFSCHERGSKLTRSSSLHPTIKRGKKIDQARDFFKFSAKYGFSMVISKPGNFQVKASSSPNNPSSAWKKWLMGILLTVILPAVGYKGGLFVFLRSKIDKAVETVEHVAEVVEEVAEKAEKLVEEVEEKLPTDSKLRERLHSFDDLAKRAVNEAKKAEDIVHRVKDVEEEIEKNIMKAGKDQPTK